MALVHLRHPRCNARPAGVERHPGSLSPARSRSAPRTPGQSRITTVVVLRKDPSDDRRKPMTVNRKTWIAIGVLAVVAAIAVIALVASGGGGSAGGAY